MYGNAFSVISTYPSQNTLKITPLSYAYNHEKQQEDDALLALQQNFLTITLILNEGDDIICYKRTLTATIGKLPCRIPWYQKLYDGFTMCMDIQHPGQPASQVSQS
jgi:hypothetical protein